jgi:hypothetical protein
LLDFIRILSAIKDRYDSNEVFLFPVNYLLLPDDTYLLHIYISAFAYSGGYTEEHGFQYQKVLNTFTIKASEEI